MRPLLLCLLLAVATDATSADEGTIPLFPQIAVTTSAGDFTLELDGRRAPISVANFVRYVIDGAYEGSVFHRVIPGDIAQGGGFNGQFERLPVRGVIPNESGNGLSNERGTIAMARGREPHSAERQFFINLGDNERLDPRPASWGYAVFGRIIEGMETLDRIASIATGPGGPFSSDVPQSPVTIEKMTLLGED
jgi:cyclophilin family peptidyl-prolyl cis-trans isomerase